MFARRTLIGLLAIGASVSGCGSLATSQRVDLAPLRDVVRDDLGQDMRRVTPPLSQPGLPLLRATFTGGIPGEQVTVLEFYEPGGTEAVLAGVRSFPDVAVMRRHNVVVLYEHTDGPDLRAALQRALTTAPLTSE